MLAEQLCDFCATFSRFTHPSRDAIVTMVFGFFQRCFSMFRPHLNIGPMLDKDFGKLIFARSGGPDEWGFALFAPRINISSKLNQHLGDIRA